jgi:hypothetical protein
MTEERRLYVVTVESEVLVVARNREEAEKLAQDESFDFDGPDYHASEMTYMPAVWDKDCLPYGLRDEKEPDRTVGEWIEAGAAPAYKSLAEMRERQERRAAKAKRRRWGVWSRPPAHLTVMPGGTPGWVEHTNDQGITWVRAEFDSREGAEKHADECSGRAEAEGWTYEVMELPE